jgi:RNA polymerase sigma factor (sigma-70 family)
VATNALMQVAERPAGGEWVADCVAIFEEQLDFIHRSLRRQGVRACDAEDLMQEVFIAVWRAWDRFDRSRPVRPWLWGIAFRVARNHLRRSWREVPSVDLEVVDDALPGEERLAAAQARALVLRVLALLPEKYRAPLVLHELDGMTLPSVAQLLSMPLPTAYTRLRRARLAFARLVEQQQGEAGQRCAGGLTPPVLLALERDGPAVPLPARQRLVARARGLTLSAPPPAPAAPWLHPAVGGLALVAAITCALALVLPRTSAGRFPAASRPETSRPRPALPVTAPSGPPPRMKIAAVERDEALSGYWAFDGLRSLTHDLSGNGSHCRLRGRSAAAAFTQGRHGGALDLAGKGWLECPQMPTSTVRPAPLTVAAWVKLHSLQPHNVALATRQIGKHHEDYFFIGFKGDQLRVGGNTWQTVVVQPTALPVERWFHVAFTHGDNLLRLYVNGREVAQARTVHADRGLVTSGLTIGAGQFSPSAYKVRQKLDGVVDELRLYERALLPSEIAALAKTPAE